MVTVGTTRSIKNPKININIGSEIVVVFISQRSLASMWGGQMDGHSVNRGDLQKLLPSTCHCVPENHHYTLGYRHWKDELMTYIIYRDEE